MTLGKTLAIRIGVVCVPILLFNTKCEACTQLSWAVVVEDLADEADDLLCIKSNVCAVYGVEVGTVQDLKRLWVWDLLEMYTRGCLCSGLLLLLWAKAYRD